MELPPQPELKDQNSDAGRVLRWVNTVLLSVLGILAGSAWVDQKNTNNETKKDLQKYQVESRADISRWQSEARIGLDSLKDNINSMKTEAAVFNASRFTSGDWTKSKEVIDTKFNEQDRRLGKVEDAVISIKDSLTTIKGGLGLLNNGKE